MKTKKNRALSVVLIFLGIIMLFPIYIWSAIIKVESQNSPNL